ncbi:fibronectin type III domain-containing protein, partial [Patescibacteria group bacterium]|nr:fibronectin type III domain-containing protein [Patescibacteria group bacterium]
MLTKKYLIIGGAVLILGLLLIFSSDVGDFLTGPKIAQVQLNPPSLTAKAVSSSQINLSWSDTNSGRYNEDGFYIECKNGSGIFQRIATVGKNITSYSNTGLNSGTTYYYRVQAFKKGVVSPYSNEASATTYSSDTIPPTVSITSPASGTTYTTAQTVTINASATDNVGVTKVEFYDGTTLVATDTVSPYTYSWSITSANNGTHSWTAKAYDTANNITVSSVVNLIVNIDGTQPSVPTDLLVVGQTCSTVTLYWSPSTDNSGSG